MTRDEILRMAREAGLTALLRDTQKTHEALERFAALVAAAERRTHQADIERWKAAAATAEKWRGLALSKDECGGGRTVQRIQQEAAAAEREACLEIADQCADADMHASMAANAIRARGP